MVFFESCEPGVIAASVSALSRAWNLTARGLTCGRIYEHMGHRVFRAGPARFVVEALGCESATFPNAHLAARRLSAVRGTATVPTGAGGYRRVHEIPGERREQELERRRADVGAELRRRLLEWATARRPQRTDRSVPSYADPSF